MKAALVSIWRTYWIELVWLPMIVSSTLAVIQHRHILDLAGGALFVLICFPLLWYGAWKIHPLFQRRGEAPRPFPWRNFLSTYLTALGILCTIALLSAHAGIPW